MNASSFNVPREMTMPRPYINVDFINKMPCTRVKVKLMEEERERGMEDGRWDGGYRFEKVVDAG